MRKSKQSENRFYTPDPAKKAEEDLILEKYKSIGFVNKQPVAVGLYSVICGETEFFESHVAIIMDDYRELNVHCEDTGINQVKAFHEGLDRPHWLKLA